MEVRQVPLRDRDRLGVVGHGHVDDTVGHLHIGRTDLGRLEHAETPALDHRGTAHADVRSLRGDDHVAATQDRGVPGEAVAAHDPDERDEAAQPREVQERQAIQVGDPRTVGVARAPATTFSEEHDRELLALGELEQTILLLVVPQALRPREDGVVVRHRDDAAPGDASDTADETVGGCTREQLLDRASPTLSGDDERRVLDERALVEQVRDVLTRGASTAGVPPVDGLGAPVVEHQLVTLEDLREVRRVPCASTCSATSPASTAAVVAPSIARGEDHEHVAGHHRVADADRDARDRSRARSRRRRAPSSSTRARRAARHRARVGRPPPRSPRRWPAAATRCPPFSNRSRRSRRNRRRTAPCRGEGACQVLASVHSPSRRAPCQLLVLAGTGTTNPS